MEEVAGEQRGLLTARCGLDLHDGVTGVGLVRRHEKHQELLFRFGRGLFLFGEVAFDQGAELGVMLGLQQPAVLFGGLQRTGPLVVHGEDVFQTLPFAGEHGGSGGDGVNAGVGQLCFELIEPGFELFDLPREVFRAHGLFIICYSSIQKTSPNSVQN